MEQPETFANETGEPAEDLPVEGNEPKAAEEALIIDQKFIFGVTSKKDVAMNGGSAFGVAVGRDMQISDGGAFSIAVGRDLEMTDSGSAILMVQGSTGMKDSGMVLALAQDVNLRESGIGILFSRQTTLGEGSKVMLDTKQALAFGAAFGTVFALLSWLLRRKK